MNLKRIIHVGRMRRNFTKREIHLFLERERQRQRGRKKGRTRSQMPRFK